MFLNLRSSHLVASPGTIRSAREQLLAPSVYAAAHLVGARFRAVAGAVVIDSHHKGKYPPQTLRVSPPP